MSTDTDDHEFNRNYLEQQIIEALSGYVGAVYGPDTAKNMLTDIQKLKFWIDESPAEKSFIEQLTPSTKWQIRSPGVLVLPTTRYMIEHHPECNHFMLLWNGHQVAVSPDIGQCKSYASAHMRQLIDVGREP